VQGTFERRGDGADLAADLVAKTLVEAAFTSVAVSGLPVVVASIVVAYSASRVRQERGLLDGDAPQAGHRVVDAARSCGTAPAAIAPSTALRCTSLAGGGECGRICRRPLVQQGVDDFGRDVSRARDPLRVSEAGNRARLAAERSR
jgi:hypothetical protein